ncbi:ChaN family lipoprotein [Flavobacterium jejuense]|uniref:ChaN family lipoprotein n=1 Tax=Flavobacterium jejuense TaxID=1544455 RepID=A0ABX0IUC0_9FLAO|nr:ChaN family lipoprotein [Flavobacterium jejuense]NHN25404.1 ChaN family lipoprotein [Flavobacterium jejuense]
MKKILEFIFIGLLFCSCTTKRTELVLLGTVHQPVQNFTPDSLYNILVKIKPDLILFEVDSSFFTKNFDFKKTWNSNENIATVKYMNNFDVDVRPYEFTGRNEYRIKIGSRPTDSKALKLLDSLYKNNQMNSLNNRVYQNFLEVNDNLNSFAYLGAQAFNNLETDKIAEIRQKYHYKEFLGIMSEYPIFADTYYVKSDGDSISFFEGFKRASEFWDLRNHTMSKNILHFVKEYHGKKIIVLNGYFHRYYLNSLIKPKEEELNFTIKEFYEY